MAYPEQIDRFVVKLNKKQGSDIYVVEEELQLADGKYEGLLAHDNVVNSSVKVYTGSRFTGEEIEAWTLSTPAETPWRRNIRIYASVPAVYVTYETPGDTVEAEDVNGLQEAVTATQTEVDRYKASNEAVVEGITTRLTTVESSKAEKTDVDSQLLTKADKSDTYTKTETDQRIQGIVAAAPAALDTLAELAEALDNDPDFAGTMTMQLAGKVDKVSGKGLSTEDYTPAEKAKLAGIAAAAGTAASATDAVIGSRTITDTATPADSGLLTTLLSGLAHMIKSITGKSSWRTAPATTLEAAKGHMDRTDNPHGVTKDQVGLGNVQNYPISSQAQAEAGTANSFYMTPLRTLNALTSLGIPAKMKRYAGDLDNLKTTGLYAISATEANLPNSSSAYYVLVMRWTNSDESVGSHVLQVAYGQGVNNRSHYMRTYVDGTGWQGWISFAPRTIVNSTTNGLMSYQDKNKLDGIASGANNYTHPAGDGNLHVPATSTTNSGKVLRAGATAGSIAWGSVASAEVTEDSMHRFVTDDDKAAWNNSPDTGILAAAADLNTIVKAGMYRLQGNNTNGPSGVNFNYGQLLVVRGTGDTIAQMLFLYGSGAVYSRAGNPSNVGGTGSWQPWKELASATLVNSSSAGLMSAADKTKLDILSEREDIGGMTVNIDDYTLSDGTKLSRYFIAKTIAATANITNIPVTGQPFLLNVELIRWARDSDYVSLQTFISASSRRVYYRWCTSGSWSSWYRSYDENSLTNATTSATGLMSAADKTKLNGVAEGANNYVHPTGAGNNHIPAGGASGQFLKYSAAGTATWVTPVKGDVGLGSVENYGIATQSEAETGSSTTKYMTPQRTAQAIDIRIANMGGGDMQKSVYDANNNGKVDAAEAADSVPWSGVTGKPSSMPANGGNADTVDGKHAAQMTARVNLSGQVQTSSYRRSVIALCEVTNTNPSLNSYSIGTLTFHRNNGLSGTFIAQVGAEKKYNTSTLHFHGLYMGRSDSHIRPCTFTHNGTKYGGVEFFFGAAELHYVEFNGATNFGIFGLDYYDTQTSSAINAEVNDSLNFNEPILVSTFRFNGQQIWTSSNFDPDSKMSQGPITWSQLRGDA